MSFVMIEQNANIVLITSNAIYGVEMISEQIWL
jgi:hypothetical protein